MKILLKKRERALIVELSGEIDHHTAAEVRECVDMEIGTGVYECLFFDFTGVTFMDSAGIGMVMGRHRKMKEFGGKTAIVGMNSQTVRVLSLTGFGNLIPFFDSNEEAFDFFELRREA